MNFREWLGLLPKGYGIVFDRHTKNYLAYSPKGKMIYPHNDKDRLREICWDHYTMSLKNKK